MFGHREGAGERAVCQVRTYKIRTVSVEYFGDRVCKWGDKLAAQDPVS